jgi:hypothetical protein
MAFIGFFLFIGAWSVAAPFDGTPDEREHIVRAAGVAAGQVAPPPVAAVRGGGAFQNVPKSLIRDNCWKHKPELSAACAPEPGGDETIVRIGSGAGRYHPLYYALVGGPLVLSPTWAGVLAARLISAALCAALLANALTDAMRWSRFRLMAVGVLATVTPIAAHMGSAINPSGVEIAAGIAFFAAAIPLLYARDGLRSRSLLWHTGLAAFALTTLRAAGPVWLAASAVALLLPLQWRRIVALWQQSAVRWWVLGLGAAAIASGIWTVVFKATYMGDFTGGRHWSLTQAVRTLLERWRFWTDELVGVLSWLDTRLPAPVYLIWEFLVASLIVWGFVLATRAGRWRLAALAVAGVVVPSLMQLSYVNEFGFITQGRYMLPVLAGLPLLAAFLIAEYGLPRDKSRSLLRIFAVALLPLHLISLVYTMVRWQHGLLPNGGLRALNPLAGPWHPPLGSVLPLVASAAGLVIVGWLVWPRNDNSAAPATDDRGVDDAAVPADRDNTAIQDTGNRDTGNRDTGNRDDDSTKGSPPLLAATTAAGSGGRPG